MKSACSTLLPASVVLVAFACCFLNSPHVHAQEETASPEAMINELRQLGARHQELESRLEEIRRESESIDQSERIQVLRLEIAGLEIENEMKALQRHAARIEQHLTIVNQNQESQKQEINNIEDMLDHVHAAHDHLREAGMDDLAEHVAERGEQLQQRLRAASAEPHPAHDDQAHDRHDNLEVSDDGFRDEVRDAIREIHGAIRELRQELGRLRDRN